jgi:GxxExxY protein
MNFIKGNKKKVPDLPNKNLIYKEESYAIIGAAMAVHNELGPGFLEAIYQEALEIEFQERNIPFTREKLLTVNYKGRTLEKKYNADFVCYNKIIVETKALNCLDTSNQSQVLNYLKATRYKLGILINFGEESLKYKRIVL